MAGYLKGPNTGYEMTGGMKRPTAPTMKTKTKTMPVRGPKGGTDEPIPLGGKQKLAGGIAGLGRGTTISRRPVGKPISTLKTLMDIGVQDMPGQPWVPGTKWTPHIRPTAGAPWKGKKATAKVKGGERSSGLLGDNMDMGPKGFTIAQQARIHKRRLAKAAQ